MSAAAEAPLQPSLHPNIWLLALGLLLAGVASPALARGLDCPRANEGTISAGMTAVDTQIMKSDNQVNLATLINDVVNRLLLQQPGLSYARLVDALVAAYCPIIAGRSDLSLGEKRDRVMRFAALARRQVSANALPQGSLIIANVPLPPDVYSRLASQAAAQNQTIAQFMEKILTRAAEQ